MGKFFIDLINGIIKGLGSVLQLVFSILPPSPFSLVDNSSVSDFLEGLAWIVPIPQIVSILQAWIFAVGIFSLVQIVLRWVKAIE